MATSGVDFFRIDRSGATKRRLTLAAVMIALGASAVGAHLMHRLSYRSSATISLLGGAVVLGGLVLGFGTMAMMLFEDVYLRLREDGLLLHDDGKDSVMPWDAIERVDADPRSGEIVVRRRDAEPLRFHAGRAAVDVAARIEGARRKAAHGLLHVDGVNLLPRN